jgi:Leucine-rich repeat (LRR) protein
MKNFSVSIRFIASINASLDLRLPVYRSFRLIWMLLLISILPAKAQIYYTLNDGSPTTRTDQFRKVNADGTGDVQIATNFADNPGLVVIDKTNNRAFIAEQRTTVSPKIYSVNLTSGANSTFVSTASSASACTSLAIDPTNNYLYYTINDGFAANNGDQLRRINLNGTGDTQLATSFIQQPGVMVLDAANNRLLIADTRPSAPKILAVNLSNNAVTTFLTNVSAVTGMTIDPVNNYLYYEVSDALGGSTNDQLRRVSLNGTGDTQLATGFINLPGDLAVDAANNRIIAADNRTNTPRILGINRSNNTSSVLFTPPGTGTFSIQGMAFVDGCANPDYQPLVDLYNATNGANWTNKTGWLSGCDPCTGNGGQPWFGLQCANGRVSRLILYQNNLAGTLPASLSALTDLTVFQINANPQLGGSIPTGLMNLTGLITLELDNNALTGSIPTNLNTLTNLQRLVLSANQLTGSIPTNLNTLTNLQSLFLDNNQLTGSIPTNLNTLTNLGLLHLNSNQLTGSIPTNLNTLTNLRRLILSDNQLTGSIPTNLNTLTNLQYLYLQNNALTGSIPTNLNTLTNLQFLHLYNNRLTGSIPTNLNTLTNLQYLYLYDNQLTGSIPTNLNTLTNLQKLYLHNNQLTGSIPANLGVLTNLQELYLNNNQLTGCFPASLSALCGGGRNVDFSDNPGLPGSGNFAAFCSTGFGSSSFAAQASASLAAVCVGQVVSLSANGGSGYTYNWIGSGGTSLSSSSDQVVSATLTSPGGKTFTVVISSGSSCSSTATVNVTGTASPTAGLTNNGPLTCNLTTVTLTASGGNSYTFTSPGGSVLGTSGATTTRVVSSPGSYTVQVGNASGCVSTTSTTVISNTATVSVTNPATTNASPGTSFNQTFTASGGTAPRSFSVASGSLPTGLSLSTMGVLSGTPTQSGSFPITVRATDANGCSGVSATYTLVVNSAVPTITGFTTLDNTICVGSPITFTASVGNVTGSYNFTVTNGTIGAPTGTTTGTSSNPAFSQSLIASGSGNQTFTLTINDNGQSASATTNVTVNALPIATLTPNFGGTLTCGQTSLTLTSSGGTYYEFARQGGGGILVVSGVIPDGVVRDGYAIVNASGVYSVTVNNTNTGCRSTATTTVYSNTAVITVSNPATATGTLNTAFNQTFTASGGVAPRSFSLASGSLPTGLSLNTTTGVLSGTPTQNGSFPITVRATDVNSCSGVSVTYTLVVNSSVPTINGFTTLDNSVCVGSPITFTATVGNVTGSYNFTVTNGTIGAPTGTTTGTSSNTSFSQTLIASGSGNQTFTLTINDNSQSASATTNVTVNSLPTAGLTNNGPLSCTLTTVTLTASGGNSYTFANGSGMVLSGSGNTRSVTESGTYSVTVANSSGCTSTASTTVNVSPTIYEVRNPTTTTATVGIPFTQSFTVVVMVTLGQQASAATPVTLESGTLPGGINLSNTGVLSGTPTQAGSFSFTVRATIPSSGCYGVSPVYTLVVNDPAPTLTGLSASPIAVCIGSPVTFTASVGNVTGSYAYTLSNGLSTPLTGTSSSATFSHC